MIGGQEWAIKLEPFDIDDAECFGATDWINKTITIYEQTHKLCPKVNPIQTLFHECIHAALHTAGVRFLMEDTKGFEETVVTAIEHTIYPLITSGLFNRRPK